MPFPHATEDHQTMNARACVEAGAALMTADAEVDGPAFEEALRVLVEDADARGRMAVAARALKTHDSAALLADAVERAAGVGA